MDPLRLRSLFDLVLRVRLIRTRLCHRHHLPVLMSLLRLLFRISTCHRVTQMLLRIRMTYLSGLLMSPVLPVFDPMDPPSSAHPGFPGPSISDSPFDGPVTPVIPDAPVTPGIIVPPTVPDVDMGLGGVKRINAEPSHDEPPATKARPLQPTPPTGSRLGGDVSPTLLSRPAFQPSGPKFFRMDTPPDDDHDPEATSSGPPPLPITDDGPTSAPVPAFKPADKPESQPSQPAANAEEESDADVGEEDTVPYSTGSDRTIP